MAIYKQADFTVRPEGRVRAERAIAEFVAYVRASEPGTFLYASLLADPKRLRYIHWMVFEDGGAEQAHRDSEAVGRFTEALYPETVDGVSFTSFDPVAG